MGWSGEADDDAGLNAMGKEQWMIKVKDRKMSRNVIKIVSCMVVNEEAFNISVAETMSFRFIERQKINSRS